MSLTDIHNGKEVKAIEAFVDPSRKSMGGQSIPIEKKIEGTSQYRVLFTDGSYLLIQACGCCGSPWLDDNNDIALDPNTHKWVEA